MTRRSFRELEHAIEQLRDRADGGDDDSELVVVYRDGETGELTHDGEVIDYLSDVDGEPVVIERTVVPTAEEDDRP